MAKVINFLKEVRQIFNQITWPKRETLIQLTVVVISISVVVSAFLGSADYLFTRSFALITGAQSQAPASPPAGGPESAATPSADSIKIITPAQSSPQPTINQ